MRNLIIHTPHAGTLLPLLSHNHPQPRCMLRVAIDPYYRLLTDHYTDKLFAADIFLSSRQAFGHWTLYKSVQQVSFPYSRLFCDVERLLDDPLEKKGLGICYDVSRWRHGPVWRMTKEQAMELYKEHHQRLALSLDFGGYGKPSLLLDCHSFSEHDNFLCSNAHEYKDLDICIGFNEDDTKPSQETLDLVSNFFQNRGYRISFNKPFSNSKTVETVHPYHSLMIEVNKHCYMDEETLEVTDGYYKLHAELQELYHLLLADPSFV